MQFQKSCSKIAKNVNMYFILLTSYLNYVAFYDKHLHYWISFKKVIAKLKKRKSILEEALR